MSDSLKIGVAGLGTVGASVVRILQTDGEMLANKAGRAVELVSVAARDKNKDRGFNGADLNWCDDVLDMAEDSRLDVIIELIGGADGVALDLVKMALENGISVITANKAMMAHHGAELAELAERNDVELRYEAAIAGAIPVVKTIREGLAANTISSVYGILNGTSNYILTEMRETGADFNDILKIAQDKGYAEADPGFDIDGVDAGHKIALLSALAFDMAPNFERVEIRGIRNITQTDIAYAEELGFRIKLLGVARQTDLGIEQSVEPCLIATDRPMAAIEGSLNAVYTESNYANETLIVGRGAGGDETASAVMSDVADILRGNRLPVFGVGASQLRDVRFADMEERCVPIYVRMIVEDKSGVLADLTSILRDLNISVKSALQHSEIEQGIVPMILRLHRAKASDLTEALNRIEKLESVKETPFTMRIIEQGV